MKQIDVCLDRHFAGQPPLKAKWQARWHKDHSHVLVLFHYQHLILVYDTIRKTVEYEWWEVPTDKRGLVAAKDYLSRM